MRWDDSGLRFPRPMRWTCARLDADAVEGHGTTTQGHRFTHGEVEVPSADAYAETLRAAGVEPDPAERGRLIREGLDALGEWRDPLRKLREVIHLVEQPLVLGGQLRRAVPLASRRRDRDRDAVAPALLPARRQPLRVRRERGRPGRRSAGERERPRGTAGRRELHVRTGREGGHRRARGQARLDRVLRRGRHLCRQDEAARRAGRSARRGRRVARGRAPREGGPGRRSSCASSRISRARSARSTRGSPATRRRSARPSRSSTCPTPPAGRCRRPSRAACSPQRTRSTR